MASGWNLWMWLVSVVVRRYIYIIDILIIASEASLLVCPIARAVYIIESVDSINRDERGFPMTQYITNGGISSARNTSTHFKHHHRVLRLISNRMSV